MVYQIIALGSSPRMRGTLRARDNEPYQVGIIPAYAGNTHRVWPRVFSRKDHPRVCGEHDGYNSVEDTLEGSSPRMRGTRIVLR